jgi:pyridinium-3,5-bisthiocarboxylic acid mononucleotide nickel chelatase
MLSASQLPAPVKHRALAVFQRIAIAEGRIHGVAPEDVGFHEVGAIDSIADIVAACAGIEALGIDEVRSSTLTEGTGVVACAHGQFPLPAPATLAILAGIPLRQADEPGERITPTGAALLVEYSSGFGPMPELAVHAIGYGLGTRDTHPRPNVLRAILGETTETSNASTDEISVIETNLDDLPPEWMASAAEQALRQGALDAFFVPATMKKGRPGVVFTILARPADTETLARLALRETSSFGVRIHTARRIKLERSLHEVISPHGPVTIKVGKLNGEILHQSPEFESCRQTASKTGVSAWTVYRSAMAACAETPVAPHST